MEDSRNVVAVHCKGGKGRTGTMICVLLIKAGLFKDADRSLEYFGMRRSDNKVSEKFQGVETASQIRYVTYYEQWLSKQTNPHNPLDIVYPELVTTELKKIVITGM